MKIIGAEGKQRAALDLYVDSMLVGDDLAPGTATGFQPATVGRTAVPVQVVPGDAPDNSDPLLATEVDLLGAKPPIARSHSFIITGTPAAPILIFKRGARQEAQDPAKVDLFVAQGASPTASSDSSATVRLVDPEGGETVAVLADSLRFGSVSAYASVDPGKYLLQVVGTNTETVLSSSKLDLSGRAGEALSLILAGSLDAGVEVFPVGADPASSLAPLQPTTVDATVNRTFGDASSDQDYALVALPGAVDMPLAQTLDGEPGTQWQAFWDDGSDQDYLIAFDGSETFTFRPGGGFWLISTSPWSVDATVETVTLEGDSVTTLPLHEGWNIISNPLSLDVPWNQVEAANPGPVQSLWRWDGAFSAADTFRAATEGEAFYFLNDAGLDELAVPYPDTLAGDESAANKRTHRPALTLRTQQNGRRTSQIRLGIHSDAEEGIDAFDQFAPPAHFETASVRFVSPAANSPPRRRFLGVDVRPDVRAGRVFDVVLSSPPGVPVELEARGLDAVGGRAAALINPASGRSYELGKGSPVTLTPRDSSTALELAIGPRSFLEREKERALPDEVELTSYPNPVERQATLEYALPAASRVRLALYDVLGRKVQTVVNAKRRAGRHLVRLDVGTLSSGMYLGRLEANGKTRTHEIVVVR